MQRKNHDRYYTGLLTIKDKLIYYDQMEYLERIWKLKIQKESYIFAVYNYDALVMATHTKLPSASAMRTALLSLEANPPVAKRV